MRLRAVPAYYVGEPVVYRATKYSSHPTPRAVHVQPESKGEGYVYEVNKYWTVAEVEGNDVVVVTRRGKYHRLSATSDELRPAAWWEKLAYRSRFPALESLNSLQADPAPENSGDSSASTLLH